MLLNYKILDLLFYRYLLCLDLILFRSIFCCGHNIVNVVLIIFKNPYPLVPGVDVLVFTLNAYSIAVLAVFPGPQPLLRRRQSNRCPAFNRAKSIRWNFAIFGFEAEEWAGRRNVHWMLILSLSLYRVWNCPDVGAWPREEGVLITTYNVLVQGILIHFWTFLMIIRDSQDYLFHSFWILESDDYINIFLEKIH